MGKLMIDPAMPGEGMPFRQCIGYAAFAAKLEQSPVIPFARLVLAVSAGRRLHGTLL